VIVVSLLLQVAAAQRTSGGNPGAGRNNIPSRTPPASPDNNIQPLFVSGRVVLDGGGALPEPVAIERICNGVSRREGYTDFKGQFQIQLGANVGFQDASEGDQSAAPSNPARGTIRSGNRRLADLNSCEFRGVLAGFQSSSAALRYVGDDFQVDVGTIVLKRMGDVKGLTVSLTTMSAPKDARKAFEKAHKAAQENKPEEEEKELDKAVSLYPQFAAAWSMLGDLRKEHSQLEEARTAYRQALAADPQYVNPAFGLATIAVLEKNWEEAANMSAQAISLNAYAYPAAYFYNAAANFNLRKLDLAEQSARKYKTLDSRHDHPDVALLLSNLLVQKQDYAGAAQQIHEYLAIVPNAQNAEGLIKLAKQLEDLSLAKKQ